ncbi:calmodulin-4-like [Argopecten irradians]|uniref:calmodulin-4-like n=1 Tax=Argopecten irradians TaxID=31199 RepID=UPI00371EF88F
MPTCRFQRYTCQISIGSTKDRYLREAPDILADTHTKMADDKKEKKEDTKEVKKEEKKEEKKQDKTDEKREDTKEMKKEEKKEEKKQENRDEKKKEKKDEKKDEKKEEKVGAKDKRKWPMTYQEEMEYLTKFEGVTHKQKLSYLNFFKMADKSNAGEITVLEFRDAVCALGFRGESFEIAAMFVDLNPDEDRFVTIDEFMNEMCKEDSRKRTQKDMKVIFDELDANKDGLITPDEIALNLKKNNRSMLEENIQSMIRKNDRDHDGGLSFKEFIVAAKRK